MVPSLREVVDRPVGGRTSEQLLGSDVPAMLAELDEPRRALLGSLATGSPLGRTRDAAAGTPADRPVPQLLAAGLLLKVDEQTVELPAQVGAALRDRPPPPAVIEPAVQRRWLPRAEVDTAAAGQALELARQAADLLAELGAAPAPVLRSGGIGIREVRRLAKQTQLDEARVGLVLELLVGAGLLASDDATSPAWTPTTAVDAWLPAERADRWAAMACAWWELPRLPGLIGRRDERDKPLVALSEELRRAAAPRDRRRVLQVLADAGGPRGRVGALTPEAVEQVLAWRGAAVGRAGACRSDPLDVVGGHHDRPGRARRAQLARRGTAGRRRRGGGGDGGGAAGPGRSRPGPGGPDRRRTRAADRRAGA